MQEPRPWWLGLGPSVTRTRPLYFSFPSVFFFSLLFWGRLLSGVKITNGFCMMTQVQIEGCQRRTGLTRSHADLAPACDKGKEARCGAGWSLGILPWGRGGAVTLVPRICNFRSRVWGNACWANERTEGDACPYLHYYYLHLLSPYLFPMHAVVKVPKYFVSWEQCKHISSSKETTQRYIELMNSMPNLEFLDNLHSSLVQT